MSMKRKWTDDYKRQIIQELAELSSSDNYRKSAILKREGLNASQVSFWRLQLGTTPRLRRRRTQEEKKAILAEYDACSEPGEKTRIVQREGTSQSILCTWREKFSREG